MLQKIGMFSACLLIVGGVALWTRSEPQGENAPEYQAVPNWLQLPKGFKFALVTAVATDKDDNLYVFHRNNKQPILVFDKTGTLLRSFGTGNVKTAHGLRIDQ